jgi:hypothetical protein
MNNRKAKYYTAPGSYNGAIKCRGMWLRFEELNRIDKTGWQRWQGPPSKAITNILKNGINFRADVVFSKRKIK